ncbi:hypothetical protein COO60DRAFT_486505 [Scenedesmus sp. NREL 46B-D3]|nr:hypothetical protein COO60DRAFT_486505 [Scenedesmus sp. NREL 46B-D3]
MYTHSRPPRHGGGWDGRCVQQLLCVSAVIVCHGLWACCACGCRWTLPGSMHVSRQPRLMLHTTSFAKRYVCMLDSWLRASSHIHLSQRRLAGEISAPSAADGQRQMSTTASTRPKQQCLHVPAFVQFACVRGVGQRGIQSGLHAGAVSFYTLAYYWQPLLAPCFLADGATADHDAGSCAACSWRD